MLVIMLHTLFKGGSIEHHHENTVGIPHPIVTSQQGTCSLFNNSKNSTDSTSGSCNSVHIIYEEEAPTELQLTCNPSCLSPLTT